MKISSNKATHSCGVPVVRSRSSAHNARRLSPAVVARASSETAASTSSGTSAAEDNSDPTGTWRDKVRDGAVAFAATAAVALSLAGPAAAIGPDPRAIETGKCLLSQCQKELAGCLADEKCDESLVCLQGCFGKPDEADCQVKCGDLYASKAIQTFNTCAVSQANCVKQKQDDGSYPVPPVESMAPGFDANTFGGKAGGRWYIVAGLNKDFDIFDCQEHFFAAPDADHMAVKINWRVARPNGQFYERSDVQTFYADERTKSIMHNNGNEYLHYQDDWYVLAFKEEEYVLVYYRGSNDAWDGYGGAVLYSRSKTVPQRAVPEIRAALSKVGLKWESFTATDNSCKPRESRLEEVEADLILVETKVGGGLRAAEKELEKDAIAIEKEVEKDLQAAEKEVEKDVAGFGRGFSSVLRKER